MPAIGAAPRLVIVGGINGCGKTTLARVAGDEVFLGQTAINPDELTRDAVKRLPVLDGLGANLIGVERAEKAVWRAIAEGENVAIETVLSTDKFIPVVRAAHVRGYHTRLVYIGLRSVELAIERVAQRVKLGGHDVPETKIRSRWPRTHDMLERMLGEVDDVLIFSNGQLIPALAGERIGIPSKYERVLILLSASALNRRGRRGTQRKAATFSGRRDACWRRGGTSRPLRGAALERCGRPRDKKSRSGAVRCDPLRPPRGGQMAAFTYRRAAPSRSRILEAARGSP
jgi:predicted ABC-type ATPase